MMQQIVDGFRQHRSSYAHPAVRRMLLLGFSSGLPFPLVVMTLSARLRQAGIDRSTIGLYTLVALAYSTKFFWSPLVDRVRLPGLIRLGQRRSWLLLAQCCVVAGLVGLAFPNPAHAPILVAILALLTAFCSSTQDIVVDAYRIESTGPDLHGATAASYTFGYYLAIVCGGAGALVAASAYGWTYAYLAMALCMCIGPCTTLLVPEPGSLHTRQAEVDPRLVQQTVDRMRSRFLIIPLLITLVLGIGLHLVLPATSLRRLLDVVFGVITVFELLLLMTLCMPALRPLLKKLTAAVVLPLTDVFRRLGVRSALPVLALIVFCRLNCITMGSAANVFYLDRGYTLVQIALVSKVYGVAMTLLGAFTAGFLVRRLGSLRSLLCGVGLISLANALYAWIATLPGHPPTIAWLYAAIGIDNVANGIAATTFIAWMSSLTNRRYTATQYALFGTLWSLPSKLLASQWGRIVDALGYPVSTFIRQ